MPRRNLLLHSMRGISKRTTMSSILGNLRLSSFAATAIKGSLAAAILGLLVCGVGADFPCKTDQIHWIGSSGKRFKCINCPECPEGAQPSVPCGSSVAYGTPVHCISCQLGKTYSDKYGKESCKACTVCSEGKAVKKNCTLFSNSECDDKCAHGFYSEPFIFDCFRCSRCCGDAKDEIAKECANYGKKCKVRSAPCSNVPTMASQTTVDSQKASIKTNQQGRMQIDMRTLLVPHHTKPPISTVPPSLPGNNRQVIGGKQIEPGENDSENKTLMILAIAGAAIAILAILGLIAYIVYGRQSNRAVNNVDENEPVQLNQIASPSQQQLNSESINLERLENDNQDLFDWMCLKLDNGRLWHRRDYERLAAKYKKISLEERNALHDELQRKGSPSKMLMSLLQTKYPNLTLRDFVGTLKEIGRSDIAQELMPYAG